MAALVLSLFGRFAGPFLVPAKTASATERGRGRGRPLGRRAERASLDGGEHGRKLSITGRMARTSRAGGASVWGLGLAVLVMMSIDGGEAAAEPTSPGDIIETAIDEAAARFDLPAARLRAVIAAESGGDPNAVSAKGAIGLMQLMPDTWREIRDRLALGQDPFDARENVLAGAFYLRRLQERFGLDGGLAAYNAGPGRYANHLAGGRPLPAETLAYVAAIRRRLAPLSNGPALRARDWRAAPLFVGAGVSDASAGAGAR
jgi:hypothetical protein